jgi:hypothetical protein
MFVVKGRVRPLKRLKRFDCCSMLLQKLLCCQCMKKKLYLEILLL